jgi:phosphate starvation-inducible protein PhoH and related proteins
VLRAAAPKQVHYIASIRARDLNFGIGPAGTGKTYLAVACCGRGAGGERGAPHRAGPAGRGGRRAAGFLPGDLSQKVDPYLRPCTTPCIDMMGFERVGKLMERNVIEVAPLAFMRGRSLNDAFVILDEAQNTSIEQMKMFLTRIGFGSPRWSPATSPRPTCRKASPPGYPT